MWDERSQELFKIFDLSSWKDRVALIEMGKPKNKCEVYVIKELSFGHVKFMMPIRHPNRCSVGILIMNTVVLFLNEVIVLK